MHDYSQELIDRTRENILHEIQCSAERYLKTGVADGVLERAAENIVENGHVYRLMAVAFTGSCGANVLDGMENALAPEEACTARADRDASMARETAADERRINGEW